MSKSFQDSISQPSDSIQIGQKVDTSSGVVAGKVSGGIVIGSVTIYVTPAANPEPETSQEFQQL